MLMPLVSNAAKTDGRLRISEGDVVQTTIGIRSPDGHYLRKWSIGTVLGVGVTTCVVNFGWDKPWSIPTVKVKVVVR